MSVFIVNRMELHGEELLPPRTQARLASLCRLWGTIRYFHPYLAYRTINWDSAFSAAVPLVRSAENTGEYAKAIETMLDALRDPVTEVIARNSAAATHPKGNSLSFDFSPDSILVFRIKDYSTLTDYMKALSVFREIGNELTHARGLVFDVRSPVLLNESYLGYVLNISGLENRIAAGPVSSPGERRRLYSGFPSQSGTTSGGYWSGFIITDGQKFTPEGPGFNKPVAFVVNGFSEIPPIALALHSTKQATIISDGNPSEWGVVTTHSFDAGEGVVVQIRQGELMYGNGSVGLQVDTVLPASGPALSDAATQVALAWVRNPRTSPPESHKVPIVAVPPKENDYPTMRYPSLPYRLLAAAKIWSVFHHFYPYNHLMKVSWDSLLFSSIPAFASARDSIEYSLAIARMIAQSGDSHVRALNSPHEYFFGTGRPPFLVQFIEQKAVITHLLDSASAIAASITVGDIVTSVDNEEIGARMQRFSPFIAASTPQSLLLSLAGFVIRGPDGTVGTYVLQGADGRLKTARVLRKASNSALWKGWRSGDIIKILPGNIGYTDLERLTVSMVDSMFESLKQTKGIIFDGRGYPRGTAWHIAPRLSEQSQPVAALFSRPVVTFPSESEGQLAEQTEVYSFKQAIPVTYKWRYKGPTVLLIDERARSQAEHTGLFLKAATNITFVGSNTAGANGDVTAFLLPGGISVWFTGHNVQWPDGRQLQRVGLPPDIEVHPTVAGFRTGRDEVLEKAIDYLKSRTNKE